MSIGTLMPATYHILKSPPTGIKVKITNGLKVRSRLKVWMNEKKNQDPLHGKTLEAIINELYEHYGWEELGQMICIRCFTHDPSIKSSLSFLRKTPWARAKVEGLYIALKNNR